LLFRVRVGGIQCSLPRFPSRGLSTWRLPFLLRVPASPVPRYQRYYGDATTSRLRISGRLWLRFRVPHAPAGSCSPWRSGGSQAYLRPGLFGQPVCPAPACCLRTQAGSPRFPDDPSRAFALVQDPGRANSPSPKRSCRCRPRVQHAEGFSAYMISGLTQSLSTCCLRFMSHVAEPMQGSLPAGWLAFAGRESNPLDRDERFQIYILPPFQDLSWR
jgi:hypothetical protein